MRILMALCVLLAGMYTSPAKAQDEKTLMKVVRDNDLVHLSALLNEQPELVDLQDEEGNTPLILAAYRGHTQMVKLMAPLSQKINHASSYGTALMAAAVKGETAIATCLLQHGADPNTGDADATTALIYASLFQHEALALLLLEAGADPHLKNTKGYSAFDYARMHKNTTLTIRFENSKNTE